jgi:hypothetical protein
MRKRDIGNGLVLAVSAILFMACSVPDSGDMAGLESEIKTMPEEDYNVLSTWVLGKVLKDYLYSHGDEDAAEMTCYDAAGNVAYQATQMLDEWLACFLGPSQPTFDQAGWDACTQRILNHWVGLAPSGLRIANCKMEFKPGMSWEQIYDRAAADNKHRLNRTAEWVTTIATVLIGSAVAPPFAIPRLLPFLCPLGGEWACPGSPYYPGPGITPPKQGDVK